MKKVEFSLRKENACFMLGCAIQQGDKDWLNDRYKDFELISFPPVTSCTVEITNLGRENSRIVCEIHMEFRGKIKNKFKRIHL
jgi:hypothetical protein